MEKLPLWQLFCVRGDDMKKYIFFDLDGTLTDSAGGITNSVAYVLKHYGISVKDKSTLNVFVGPPLVESFMKYYGFDREQARASVEIYREYFEDKGMFENAVYPGIPELLDGLKKDGYKLYVATSKPEQYSVKIIEHFGLAEYFEMVGGADMNETRVHKGDVIRYVMESCGFTDSSEIVMVGDRENDMNGARQNHMESVGVLYGYGSREELENSGACHIAKTVEELGKVLRSL